ncbi:MAG: hypothetical protein QGG40_10315 [Myxococcota bacterium]|jgi:hypothetical protein|nr:hypothetical protein [Myxococcota bacterium]
MATEYHYKCTDCTYTHTGLDIGDFFRGGAMNFKGNCSDCEELFDFSLDPGDCVECGVDEDGDTVFGPPARLEPRCPNDENWDHFTEVWDNKDGCPRCQGELGRTPTGTIYD